MTRRALAAVLLLAVALVAGCDASSHVVVHPDGSGTYGMVLSIDGGPEHAGDDVYRSVREALSDSEVPIAVHRYDKDGQVGAELRFTFRSLADLQAEVDRVAKLGGGLGEIALDRSDTGWHFTSTATGLDGPPRAEGLDVGPSGGPIDPTRLLALYHLSVTVDLPGAPGVSNATAVTRHGDTTTFTWKLEAGRQPGPLDATTTFLGNQGDVDLATRLTPVRSSRASDDDGDSGSGPVIAVVAGVVLAGTGATLLVRRRRRATGNREPVRNRVGRRIRCR